uniref:BZIP domain-containing protein n=1 Tax=Caenorhabditis tropicalis TaxID=1561998 RepID=A0A1I7U588_9PELO
MGRAGPGRCARISTGILRDSTLPALLPTNVLNTTNPTGSCSTGTFSVSVDSPFHVNNLVNPNAPSRSLGMNTDTFKKGAKKRKTNVERRSKKIKKFSKYSKDSNSDDDDEDDEALCPSNMPQKPPEGPPPPPTPPPPSASITA